MSDFFSMGGFGVFIWSAMGIALALMVLEVLALTFKRRALINQIKRNNRLEARTQNNAN